MPTIIHFDIAADDIERVKNFYEQLFDWEIEKFPDSEQGYYLIKTKTATGEVGISGGIAKREKDYQHITNFIQVDSIDKSMSKVLKLGGEIIEKKTEIPTVGYIVECKDTEENIFGLIELEKK